MNDRKECDNCEYVNAGFLCHDRSTNPHLTVRRVNVCDHWKPMKKNTGTTDGYCRSIQSSKAKCKRQRDNWKARALAYRDIIKRVSEALPLVCYSTQDILNEADKIMEGK